MFKKLFINARYFIAPLLILATLFGILEGGPWVWTGVFLLGVGIVIDTLYTQQTYGGFDEDETNVQSNLTELGNVSYVIPFMVDPNVLLFISDL